MKISTDTMLRKAHLRLMRHPETCLYSGIVMMGKAKIVDSIPTACTDGLNCLYNENFVKSLSEPEINALVLHENLHKALRHIPRFRKLLMDDQQLINAAMDYVVNDVIVCLKDPTLAKLPKGGLYDARFHNWSVLDVYDYLRQGIPPSQAGSSPNQKGQGQGQGQNKAKGQSGSLPKGKPQRGKDSVKIGGEEFPIGGGFDEHDFATVEEMSEEELKKLSKDISEALTQGGMLAGRLGAKVPRTIQDSLVVPVDWRKETQEFLTTFTSGRDEYTYRKFNRRRLADDYYLPSVESETVGEIIVGIDTSGSIGGKELSDFAAHLKDVCTMLRPDKVRVLWWDTTVHAEQVFEKQYDDIARLLKPVGGGGTRAGAVRDYIVSNKINAECVLMFTDGYVESTVDWSNMTAPTLWLVTLNKEFYPPAGGRKVKVTAEG